jgi:RNA polymerase sigma-70 factor, ECF subfamily
MLSLMKESVEFDLLAAIRHNDQRCIVELQAIVAAVVRKWNWGGPGNVDDIVQDCLLRLLQNIRSGKFRGDSSFMTYIYAIVRNTCIDYYKERKTLEGVDIDSIELMDQSLSAEERLANRDRRRVACRVLLSLPEECRRLWRAIFFGKRNYKQAADLLGLTEGTVKRRMWECRQIASEKLKSLETANLRWFPQTK